MDDHRHKRPIPWSCLILVTGMVLITLPCLGLMGSLAYLKFRQAGVLSRWQSLGTPPDGGVEIVTGDTGVVYVRTDKGEIYGCEHLDRDKADDCWHIAQKPLSVDSRARFDERLYQGEVEPPPGTVVDSLEVTVWFAEDAFETRYILLEDGIVWKWEYDAGAYFSIFVILVGPAAGLITGIVVVVILWVSAALLNRSAGEGRVR